MSRYRHIVETGKPWREETFHEDVSGGKRPRRVLEFQLFKLGDGFAAIWRDITHRTEAEEELHRHSRRSGILAAASAAFAEAGVDDLDEVLDVVATELVARVGDQCVIWLLGEGVDSIHAATIKSTDPAAAAAREALARRPLRIDDLGPVADVLHTGRPVLAVDVEGLVATLRPEYVEFLHRFRVETMMSVPLSLLFNLSGLRLLP